MVRAIEWLGDRVRYLDQTALPIEERALETRDVNELAGAIRTLSIRGAPLIGIAAAYGLALAARSYSGHQGEMFYEFIRRASDLLASTRPTAVNLTWALRRMNGILDGRPSIGEAQRLLTAEAIAIHREDEEMCRQIGAHGSALLGNPSTVITHCNAGALATGGEGTALAVIAHAHRQGKTMKVFVDETRPLLQGSRLTMWELMKEGIDATLITDNTAAAVMRNKAIDAVITGADRIAANGDAANKVGTYGLAVAARHHGIPMYIAAPSSTIDALRPDGSAIPIEERSADEVTSIGNQRIAPPGARVFSPAFDVTPAGLISAIITEKGICRPPFSFSASKGAARS